MADIFERNIEAEYELINELVDNFDFECMPTVVDAIAEHPDYAYLLDIESLHNAKDMRKNCRALIKEALDFLASKPIKYTFTDEKGEHEILESSIRGQFDVIVTYDMLTGKYTGVLKYVAFSSEFGL